MSRPAVRIAGAVALVTLAIGGMVLAAGFLAAALFLAIADRLGPVPAALCLAGVMLVVATSCLVLLRFAGTSPASAPPAPYPTGNDMGLGEGLGQLLGKELAIVAHRHPMGTMAASLLAGIAVGASPRLRNDLRSLLR